MATAPTSGSTQYSVNAAFSKTYNGGTKVTVKDSSGNEVLTYTPAKNFQSFVFSTDKLKSGETYTIYAGDTQEGTFTVSDITTTVGNVSSGMGGGKPGGMQGGRTGKNSGTTDNTGNTNNTDKTGNSGNTQNNGNNKVTNSNSNQA